MGSLTFPWIACLLDDNLSISVILPLTCTNMLPNQKHTYVFFILRSRSYAEKCEKPKYKVFVYGKMNISSKSTHFGKVKRIEMKE